MYKITTYRPELLEETAELFQWLNAGDNKTYLKWRYSGNEQSPGLVALHGEQVVGFRGFLETPWMANGSEVKIVCLGDTVVHPDHRLQGLSIAMGNAGFEEYGAKSAAFANFSCGPTSYPGYLKLGFEPLVDKKLMYTKIDTIKHDPTNIYKSDSPDGLQAAVPYKKNKIVPIRDDALLKWRFGQPGRHCLCYYHKVGDTVTDYIVVSVSGGREVGHIIDYTENDIKVLENILRYMIYERGCNYLCINRGGLSNELLGMIERIGFEQKQLTEYQPILIRSSSWFIDDLDIREVNNWEIRELYRDSV